MLGYWGRDGYATSSLNPFIDPDGQTSVSQMLGQNLPKNGYNNNNRCGSLRY